MKTTVKILLLLHVSELELFFTVHIMFVIIFFRNSTDHQKILDEANGKHKMVLDKLNEERALLEVCLAICLIIYYYYVEKHI